MKISKTNITQSTNNSNSIFKYSKSILLFLSLLSYQAYSGLIQDGVNKITSVYGVDKIQIPEELEQGLVNTYKIITQKKETVRVKKSKTQSPKVQCGSTWIIYSDDIDEDNSLSKFQADPMIVGLKESYQPIYDLDQSLSNIQLQGDNNSSELYKQLKQTTEPDLAPTVDEMLILFDELASGARLANIMPNYQTCRDSVTPTIKTWSYFTQYQQNVNDGVATQWDFWTYTDNITGTISNSADTVNKCTKTTELSFASFKTYYAGFTDVGNYILSMVMNLVANTQSLINVMNQVTAADNNCDLKLLYYNVGRIVRYVTQFDPITAQTIQQDLKQSQVKSTRQVLSDILGDDKMRVIEKIGRSLELGLKQYLANPILKELKYYTFEQLYNENFEDKILHKGRKSQNKAKPIISNSILSDKRIAKTKILEKYQLLESKTPQVQDSVALTDAYKYSNITYGFLNGTSLYGKPNTTWCQSNQTRYMQLILDYIPNSLSEGKVFDIVYSLSELMAKLYPLQSSCRFGTYEAMDQLKLYRDGYSDIWDFMDTFSFNFGLLYDSVVTSIQSVKDLKYFMSGYSVGRTVFYLFFMA
eukprot:403346794